MTTEALAFIDDELNKIGINYEFAMWKTSIPKTFWIGEFIGIGTVNEDGMDESSFILTGTTSGDWLDLIDDDEKIQNLFPAIGGKIAPLDNGSTIAIFYENSFDIPTETMDLKRIQINLRVKEWRC